MRLMSFGRHGGILVSLGLALSACNTSNPTAVLGAAGKTNTDLAAPSDTITESELRAFCPNVELREGTAFFTKYEKGGAPTDTTEADKTKVIHQASLGEVTRSCTTAGETLTMNCRRIWPLGSGTKSRCRSGQLAYSCGGHIWGFCCLFGVDAVRRHRRSGQRRSHICVQQAGRQSAKADRPVLPRLCRL